MNNRIEGLSIKGFGASLNRIEPSVRKALSIAKVEKSSASARTGTRHRVQSRRVFFTRLVVASNMAAENREARKMPIAERELGAKSGSPPPHA